MASRTLLSKSCIKTSLAKAAISSTKKNLLNNKTTIFPAGSQVSRQATTASVLVDTSTTHGRLSTHHHFFDYGIGDREPANLVKFTSVEGKRLFRSAMVQGYAESFFKLMGNFSTQTSQAYGGVSSLAMVLNALEIDPKRTWKGNWRWFSTEQMKTCTPVEEVQEKGIPFDEFTCLAQSHCKVVSRRGTSYQDFLADLESVTSGTASQMVVNYSRTCLGQQDDLASHFSPIGGYNKKEQHVLIMDVARGKYPSVWVNAKTLYSAMMATSQEEAGRSRGYFVLSNYAEQQFLQNGDSDPTSTFATNKLRCKECTRNCHSSA